VIVIEKATSFLIEWTVRYLKNKDAFFKKIQDLKTEGNRIFVKTTDKDQTYIIEPFIDTANIDALLGQMKEDYCALVIYNTKQNLDIIIKEWKKLANFKKQFSIYFVNPFSKSDRQWIIFPYTHDMIAEGKGIKEGLMALASNVDPITKDEIAKLTE
jgi:hypothetical protein